MTTKRRLSILALLLLGLPTVALCIEHWRGERALRALRSELAARGEALEFERLWPAPDPAARVFVERLTEAVERLPSNLDPFVGTLSGLSLDASGRPLRGSRLTSPLLVSQPDGESTWQDLGEAVQAAEPALESLRALIRNPPRATASRVTERSLFDPFPNHGKARLGCQLLKAAVINDLHCGDLGAAAENLEALQACSRAYYADDPTLVTFMMRVAFLGLVDDAAWDAFQDEGWTEPQLRRLQDVGQTDELFPQMLRCLAAERVGRLAALNWFAAHDYQEWVDQFAPIYQGSGMKPADLETANWKGQWRRRVFHPAWSYAWRAQEELDFLQYSQQDMETVRDGARRRSWIHMKEQQAALRWDYLPPAAGWRFYLALPLLDPLHEIIGSPRTGKTECPYTDFSRAWLVAARAWTIHGMVQTVVALKRYRLREGRAPRDLASLVPDFLGSVPRDWVDGQPLRYRRSGEDTFTLYSVGEDGRDDGGDSRPALPVNSQRGHEAWLGRDWVWPQVPAARSSVGR